MKNINKNVISFIGDIIFKYNLGEEFITDKINNSSNSDVLERTLELFFNEKVIERKKNGENPIDFHPLSKLTLIIQDLINNIISYDDVMILLIAEMDISMENAHAIYLMIKENNEIKELVESEDLNDESVVEKETQEKILKTKSIAFEILK